MDLFDVVRSCFRRWYVVLPLLFITAWYSLNVYSSVQPVYYANTVLGVAPPSVTVETTVRADTTTSNEVRRNGLLDVGGATLLANLTALALRDQSVLNRVVAAGGLPTYTSEVFPTPAGTPQLPLVMIEETSADPVAVSKTLELVSAQAEVTLRTLQQQAGVPEDQMVAPFVVSPPSVPGAAMPTRTRSTIAIFVAGAGLSVLFAVLADVLLTRRKTRAAAGRHAVAPAAAGPNPVHPPSDVQEPNGRAPVTEGALDAR